MKYKVLVIEENSHSMRVLKRVIGKARLQVVETHSLTEAKYVFRNSTPEEFLCAVVDYNLPDASEGEAIDYAIDSFVPVVVITDRMDDDVREHILSKAVVDYIPKENAQVFEYLSRLLHRLQKNKNTGVLVVDDSRISRNNMVSLLSRHNFITYSASNAQQAMEALNAHSNIKLMITDENMPKTSGVELVADARRLYDKDQLAIIGLSSDRSSALLARFIKSGANDYLNKPFCHEEFFCRVLQNVEHIEQIEAIQRAANSDYLTDLPNRRHFFAQVENQFKRGVKRQCLALMDLDHFKSINDNYGHDGGDLLLKTVAKLMESHFDEFIISRFGGEEFCVFFPEIGMDEAVDRLNVFRQDLSQKTITLDQRTFACTISIGVTEVFDGKIESMLSAADANLYRAKAQGRNQVVKD
jgi:diguanylate cyclase (GGDEF)-like protein